jgi:hypothetical protein
MNLNRNILIIFISLLVSLSAAYSETGTYLSSFLGASESLNSDLKLYLTDQSDIKHEAEWNGNSFKDSLYYAIRVEKWKGNKGKGIEWIHHKIYLDNTTDIIEDFSISDGFNLLLFNWATYNQAHDFTHRVGVGLVLAHIDTTLSGRERFYMDGGIGGSYISGITSQLSLEKWIYETDAMFVNVETKLTLSYARVPISSDFNEFADVSNIGFHVLLGLGSKPVKKEAPLKEKATWVGIPLGYHLIAQYMPTDSIN